MKRVLIGCSILKDEIRKIMEETCLKNDIVYIDAALHVDLDILQQALTQKLNGLEDNSQPVILVGNKCHPDIQKITEQYNGKIIQAANCIELLLGDKIKEFDQEAKTFYITSGWLARWRDIFVKGLGWDNIDARQNFGYYDRTILIDTGLTEISEEDLLEFFEYTQVPVEIYTTTLENLKNKIQDVL